MGMRIHLACPEDFRFLPAVCSHGFFMLAPNRWEPPEAAMYTTIPLGDERAVEVRIRAVAAGVEVASPASLSRSELRLVRAGVSRMLRLDEDLSPFHQHCAAHAVLKPAARVRFGRLLRSASLFEDIVKVICTCNITWGQTVRMIDELVGRFGAPAQQGGPRAFPTPARLAAAAPDQLRACGLGYRGPYIQRLSRAIVEGRLDLVKFEQFTGPTASLHKALQALDGVGPYAASSLCMLLGRYDCLAADSEMRRFLQEAHPRRNWTPARVAAHYKRHVPWQFLVYWFELWSQYVRRHGDPANWSPQRTGPRITRRSPGEAT